MSKPRVLFVHTYPKDQLSSFVQIDLSILRERYEVQALPSPSFTARPFGNPGLWRAVAQSDVVFAWFARCAPAILTARLLGKPSLLVAGGADAVSVPEIGYGLSDKRVRKGLLWITLALRWATRVLLFSNASRKSLLELRGVRSNNLDTLYLGVDIDHFKPGPSKEPHALTVSYISDENLRRKGVYTFLDAARLAPDIQFRLGGKPIEAQTVARIQGTGLPNLTYLGFLTDEQLLGEYQRAGVYAQLSLHEGFGMALAEAMACGCIPVVTRRGSIPEVVGDCGTYVPVDDPAAAAEAIRRGVRAGDVTTAQRARERVADLFSIQKRRTALWAAIEAAI